MNSSSICLIPRMSGVGGMVSFQHKLAEGLQQRGIKVSFDLEDPANRVVLVIGGTRQLAALWRARRRSVRIVQRLDGMNWLHRLPPHPGLRHYLRAEYGNWLLGVIRSRLSDHIVYQSEFSHQWWERKHGPAHVTHNIIYNGVDLNAYSPAGPQSPPADRWRVLMVEGSLMGGYEQGLEAAVQLVQRLADDYGRGTGRPVELLVVGRASEETRRLWNSRLAEGLRPGQALLNWAGLVERSAIPEFDRSAHLLYSSDIHPACPNSVIEALACGLPVLAFDTGSLVELVTGDSGRVVPYGGDAWRLDPPDVSGLAQAAVTILDNQPHFRQAARWRAEAFFGLERMVDNYLEVLVK